MKKVVLGVGNTLLSDEGLGIKALHMLRKRKDLPEDVVLVDGGTLSLNLLDNWERIDKLIIIDTIKGGKPPGTVYKLRVKVKELLDFYQNKRLSLHQINLYDLFYMAHFLEKFPEELIIFGIEPESFEPSLELSKRVREGLPKLLEEIIKELRE